MDWWASNYCPTANPTLGEGNQLMDATTPGTIFDPWLNCDDLDLGALLHQNQTGGGAGNQHQTANNQQFSQTTRAQVQQPTHHQSRLPADNKRHIISIINNSSASSQYNQQQHVMPHQQQTGISFDMSHCLHSNNQSISSTAASPHSSSLGSSPPNHHTASLLSPPHSSTSPIFANHQDQKPTAYFIECFEPNQNQQQQLYVANQQSATTACYGLSSVNTTPPTASPIIVTCGNTTRHVGPNAMSTTTTTTTTTTKTSGGSSLLTSSSSAADTKVAGPRRPYIKRNARQVVSTGGNPDGGALKKTSDRGGPKTRTRNCRHITDFALSSEEKRLLIKEGYPDFPASCHARPLTKLEERILRKIRRKIRNKRSAQCSRQRKKEYVEELELKYAQTLAENEELRRLLAATTDCTNELQRKHPINDNSTSGESSMDQISWGVVVPQQQQQQQAQSVDQESRAIVHS